MAGVTLAFTSAAAVIIEFSLGANPLLHELVEEPMVVTDGVLTPPTRPGLGVTPRLAFIEKYSQP
jgi:L-alanine-DL-glutamate epimerase-like enolase superfamily enzyme